MNHDLSSERLIESYKCALSSKVLCLGTIFLTDKNLYFYSKFNKSTLIGKSTKILLSYELIKSIKKEMNSLKM